MEKLFEDYKGVILFYIVIALLAFICSSNLNAINNVSNNNPQESETVYCA